MKRQHGRSGFNAGKSRMTQEEYIRRLCELREVGTELELEIVTLYDRKSKYNDWPIREASVVIDKLKACPKKACHRSGKTGQ